MTIIECIKILAILPPPAKAHSVDFRNARLTHYARNAIEHLMVKGKCRSYALTYLNLAGML
jgi:hypothetical protein